MVVRTLDDIKKESSASGGTGMGGGMAPAANPFSGGGGAAAGGNYTTAGGYTPIPDQYSMGGVGPGDVFIDACGETVPVLAFVCAPPHQPRARDCWGRRRCCFRVLSPVFAPFLPPLSPFLPAFLPPSLSLPPSTPRGQVASLSPWQLPLAMCCPCCIGDPCSQNRRNWYVAQMQTFIGIITILQILIFILEVALAASWSAILDVPSPVLAVMGGKVAPLIAAGEYWRLVTPIMLHAGIFHLLINCFTQCMFGIQLEREWGAPQIAIIYVTSGIYGNVLSVLFAPQALSIGCSGAIFGLFGAQVAYITGMWRSLGDLQKKMLILSLGLSFIFIFAFSFSVGVDMSAHLGGFICGMVMGLGYFSKLWAEDNWWHQHGKVIAFGMVAATIIIPAIYFWHNEELGYGNSDF